MSLCISAIYHLSSEQEFGFGFQKGARKQGRQGQAGTGRRLLDTVRAAAAACRRLQRFCLSPTGGIQCTRQCAVSVRQYVRSHKPCRTASNALLFKVISKVLHNNVAVAWTREEQAWRTSCDDRTRAGQGAVDSQAKHGCTVAVKGMSRARLHDGPAKHIKLPSGALIERSVLSAACP